MLPDNLPAFPVDINRPELIGFVDAAHANDLRKQQSTTGYVFTFMGGAIIYRSVVQSVTALSSTKAEFIAAVAAAKAAKYLRTLLSDLQLPPDKPTILYEDNESTIKIINNKIPTSRTRHCEIRFFAIQGWKEEGSIDMKHIPGILNPSDSLTKLLGWVLHTRHVRRMMGHYPN